MHITCCYSRISRYSYNNLPFSFVHWVCAQRVSRFLIRQLLKLQDHKDPAYDRYVKLLENYSSVNIFSMIFQLDDWQDIYYYLFDTMFKVARFVLINMRFVFIFFFLLVLFKYECVSSRTVHIKVQKWKPSWSTYWYKWYEWLTMSKIHPLICITHL